MVKPGKTVPSLKKPLGLQMKGSPYPMTASQENTFGKDGTNPNPGVYNGIKAADANKNQGEGPEFLGALVGGLASKFLASKVGGAIAGVAKTAVSGVGEGIGGLAEGLKDKVGGGGKGAFKDKVKNYVGSLDLITNSSPDGSLKQNAPSTSEDSDKNITKLSGPGDVSTTGQTVGADLKIPNTNISMDKSAVANKQEQDRGIIGGKDYSKGLAPLNKLKKMCRG